MLSSLIIATLLTFIIIFLITSRYLSLKISFTVSLVKSLIPYTYFSFVGTKWTPYDGRSFQAGAEELLESGYGPVEIILNWGFLIDFVDSIHVIPYWWNMVAQTLFGYHYFSAVFLNVTLTVVIGVYTMFILSHTGLPETYYKWFFVFFLLHWDVITWSSLINMKGMFVTLLIVIYIYSLIRLNSSDQLLWKGIHGLSLAIILLIMYYSRFYMIAILAVTSVTWLVIEEGTDRIRLTVGGIMILIPALLRGIQTALDSRYTDSINIVNTITGFLRILATPRPWGVNENFTFLVPAAILHWLLLPAAILFGLRLAYHHKNIRLISIFLLVFISFYSIFDNLVSARIQFQIVFIFTVFQFHALYRLVGILHLKNHRVNHQYQNTI